MALRRLSNTQLHVEILPYCIKAFVVQCSAKCCMTVHSCSFIMCSIKLEFLFAQVIINLIVYILKSKDVLLHISF